MARGRGHGFSVSPGDVRIPSFSHRGCPAIQDDTHLRAFLWPHRRGFQRREPTKNYFNKFTNVIWSHNKRSCHGFALYFECAKLHTSRMVPAYYQSP